MAVPLWCATLFIYFAFSRGVKRTPFKKKQNDGSIAPSLKKRFECFSHDFKYFFLLVNVFGLGKKVG